jgi:S-adenosylmethionine-dependent methyltransferase
MPTSAAVFDTRLPKWIEEQNLPWGKLKYKLVQAHLARHIGQGQALRILDAGGGNGLDSIPLAEQGHRVDLVDYSREMLAEAERQASLVQAHERVNIHYANVQDLPQLFPQAEFDLVLCHNVLQYVEDVRGLLKNLAACLKPGGLLSVVSINRYSIAYRAALPGGNLTEALEKIDVREMQAFVFNTPMVNYSAEEVGAMLQQAGYRVEQDYGIRCICDYWEDNQLKFDPVVFQQLERLEFALAEKYPYKLLARYFQVIARKT